VNASTLDKPSAGKQKALSSKGVEPKHDEPKSQVTMSTRLSILVEMLIITAQILLTLKVSEGTSDAFLNCAQERLICIFYRKGCGRTLRKMRLPG